MTRNPATDATLTASPAPDRATAASEAVRFVYLLYLMAPVFAGSAVLGYAMARKHECRASDWLVSHLRFQRRLFWRGFFLILAGALTTAFWAGWAILLLALLYWLFESLKGLRLYMAGEPCPGPEKPQAKRGRQAPVALPDYAWEPDSEEAPWLVRRLRLAPLVERWRDFTLWARRARADLPERLLGPEFDPLTAPTSTRLGDRLFWEIFEIWEDAVAFIWLMAVGGVLLWSLALVASPASFAALGWTAAYLFLRFGLSAGLIAGAYAGAGWRFAWARHKQEDPSHRVATFPAFALLACFAALGAFLAANFV